MVIGRHAALDVGSNTIRLLVAEAQGQSLVPVRDESEFVRLGLGVDTTGELDPERERVAVRAIERLADIARDLGAMSLPAIATSAVRDARNGQAFIERVREATGVEIRIITGEEEAELTYLGATIGISLDAGTIVVDLGGGSAEIVAAGEAGIRWARSVPLGSGRLTERFIDQDPPGAEAVQRLKRHVDDVLAGLPEAQIQRAILTGGTATHIAILAGRNITEGSSLCFAPGVIDDALKVLCSRPAADIVREFSVRSERAAVLPAGVAAISAIINYFSVVDVVITRQGIREGVIRAAQQGILGF